MESIKSFCDRKLLGYSLDQYIIMFAVFLLFLPYYIGLAAFVGITIYLIVTKQLKQVISYTPNSKWAILFGFYSLLISIMNNNERGIMQSSGMIFIIVFILYYRKHVNERLFTFIVDTCCLLSIACFVWGLMEYSHIVNRLGYPFSDLIVENAPEDRINSTFYNANFYAMMIQFIVLMCIYKILHAKTLHRIVFYTTTIFCNLFALYLTGCRAGWLSFIVTIPLMFYVNKRKYTTYSIFGIISLGLFYIFVNPTIIPRFDNIFEYFFDRTDIWTTAILGIKESFWIGKGPSAYYLIFQKFNGPLTVHSHNVYLDPFLSFGMFGVLLASLFVWPIIKEIYWLYKNKVNYELFGLILCFILTVMIHGIFDYTVFWIQTGVVFLMVFNAGSIYKKRNDKIEIEN